MNYLSRLSFVPTVEKTYAGGGSGDTITDAPPKVRLFSRLVSFFRPVKNILPA
jgi:hypothetical protein